MEYDSTGTGEPRVDQAMAALDRLAKAPPDQQVAAFEQAHAALRQVLSELDSEPGAGLDSGPGGGSADAADR